MAIYAPAKRINPNIRRRSGGRRKNVYAALALTSMVDMFAIMVIFLLQSFSAEGEIIVLPPGLQLPRAANTGSLERAPSVVISLEGVFFQGEEVAKTPEMLAAENWNVEGLRDALTAFKQEREQILAEGGSLEVNSEIINVSADKRLEFEAVKKVLYTVGHAGFPRYRLAVVGGSPSGEKKIPQAYPPRR